MQMTRTSSSTRTAASNQSLILLRGLFAPRFHSVWSGLIQFDFTAPPLLHTTVTRFHWRMPRARTPRIIVVVVVVAFLSSRDNAPIGKKRKIFLILVREPIEMRSKLIVILYRRLWSIDRLKQDFIRGGLIKRTDVKMFKVFNKWSIGNGRKGKRYGNVKLKLKLQLQARGDNFARVHQPHQPGELNHTGWFPSHAAALISTSLHCGRKKSRRRNYKRRRRSKP